LSIARWPSSSQTIEISMTDRHQGRQAPGGATVGGVLEDCSKGRNIDLYCLGLDRKRAASTPGQVARSAIRWAHDFGERWRRGIVTT
jgi:hypothetical protein